MNNEKSAQECKKKDAKVSQIDTKSTDFKISLDNGMATWKIGDETTKSVPVGDYCLEYFGDLDMDEDKVDEVAGNFKFIT